MKRNRAAAGPARPFRCETATRESNHEPAFRRPLAASRLFALAAASQAAPDEGFPPGAERVVAARDGETGALHAAGERRPAPRNDGAFGSGQRRPGAGQGGGERSEIALRVRTCHPFALAGVAGSRRGVAGSRRDLRCRGSIGGGP